MSFFTVKSFRLSIRKSIGTSSASAIFRKLLSLGVRFPFRYIPIASCEIPVIFDNLYADMPLISMTLLSAYLIVQEGSSVGGGTGMCISVLIILGVRNNAFFLNLSRIDCAIIYLPYVANFASCLIYRLL